MYVDNMEYDATLASGPLPTDPVPQPPSRRRKACDNCRRRKERCDGLEPCGRCRRRRVEAECRRRLSISQPPPRQCKNGLVSTGSQPSAGAASATARSHDAPARADGAALPDTLQELPSPESSPSLTTVCRNLSISSSPGSPLFHVSRLIRNSDGAYILLGPSANLCLLQSVRQLVYSALGSCPFTEEPPENDFVEEEPAVSVDRIDITVRPPRPSPADARYYLKWYASATSCVVDLFDYEELEMEIIPWLDQPATADANSCMYFLVLAIGAQCGPHDHDTQADAYFRYGHYLASTHFLGTVNLVTVQIYCLIATYLLNASRPNAANMHLSVAIRAAHSLGIHRADVSALFSAAETSKRERVWKVLRVTDLYLSTSLGQQPSTTETRDTMSQPEYSPSTDLCYVFEKILSGIYANKQEVSPTVLQHVTKHHREWASHFREGLTADRIPAEEYVSARDGNKQLNIGLTHLKEAYYWTILLVTRPYLIDLVQKHVTNHSTAATADNVFSPLAPEPDTLLAHASVNSAVLTIDLLQGFLAADEIPKRLPYVINSIFNAAMVLGMGFFADLDRLFPLNHAMRLAEKLLDRFQSHDPRARWSLHTVRNLHSACDEFVKLQSERRLKRQRTLVEGLFGEVKPCYTGVRMFPSSRSSPQNPPRHIPQEENRPLHGLDNGKTPSSEEFLHNLQLEENNAIWSQLFYDDAPDPLWGDTHAHTDTHTQSREIPYYWA